MKEVLSQPDCKFTEPQSKVNNFDSVMLLSIVIVNSYSSSLEMLRKPASYFSGTIGWEGVEQQ